MPINNPQIEHDALAKDKVDSIPPEGKFKVTNLFVNPETGRLIVEYDDEVENG